MQEIKLNAEMRDGVGKGPARKIRATGRIPTVLYGPETKSELLSVETRELAAFLRTHGSSNILIDLFIEGEKKPRKVIFRELQRDPVRGDIEHLDLYQVSMTKKISLTTSLELTGTPAGALQGGIVQHVIRELDILCLPTDIPEKVRVDITELNIGDSLHVSDISIDKVEILTNLSRTIVTVVPPTIVKTAAEIAEEEGEVAEGEEVAEEGEVAAEEGKEEKTEAEEKKE